ncbi:hypothetical protein PoB_005300400 [Plakobranchus ocellatus]|uniref:Uncharacterized protein n=1 Tax=Plakobranchus ocellatus TaxID=259542 RepID=A0AAV4C621_9GAST|nr:hypothetical protein PoB_005300400 [Plakobranchus ocellatus]
MLPGDTVEDDKNSAIIVGQAFKSFSHLTHLLKKREEKLFVRLVIGQGSELVSYANQRLKGLKNADCLVYRKVTFRHFHLISNSKTLDVAPLVARQTSRRQSSSVQTFCSISGVIVRTASAIRSCSSSMVWDKRDLYKTEESDVRWERKVRDEREI